MPELPKEGADIVTLSVSTKTASGIFTPLYVQFLRNLAPAMLFLFETTVLFPNVVHEILKVLYYNIYNTIIPKRMQ